MHTHSFSLLTEQRPKPAKKKAQGKKKVGWPGSALALLLFFSLPFLLSFIFSLLGSS
jgi:hypothetical protein